MSAETSFLNVERITINPVQTSRCFNASDSIFSTQRLVIHCADGGQHALTFYFFQAGQNALALGEVVTNDKVSA